MARHPGEGLGRGAHRRDACHHPGRAAARCGQARDEDVPGSRRGEQRADHVRAAALVLLGDVDGRAVVLVAADRLVLGAVVAGDARAAQGHHRRNERGAGGDHLDRCRMQTGAADHLRDHAPSPRARRPSRATPSAAAPRAGAAGSAAAGRRPRTCARRRAGAACRRPPRAARACALTRAGRCRRSRVPPPPSGRSCGRGCRSGAPSRPAAPSRRAALIDAPPIERATWHEEAHGEIEVVERDALVRRVDQRAGDHRVHRASA